MAPPVVLLHSSGLSSRQWSRWSLPGRRRLAPELWPGAARGGWPGPWPFRLRTDLDEVLALLAEHGPVDLVGHSYGGALALFAAAARPDLVRRVVAYEPPVTGVLGPPDPADFPPELSDPEGAGTEAWLEGFVDWWNGPGAWRRLAAPIRQGFLRVGREIWGSVQDLVHEPRPLSSYAALPPTLLLHGDRAPDPITRALAQLATLPQVEVDRIAGLDHQGPFLAPEQVEARARAFLDG